ncbi:hypothetical protein V7127_25325 [Bacillus sp. JJ1773]|uniref:hypothetical protein n=1 Tax=Bacillus sp. JJ1773 TaxID=3122965 RepID=UPI00300054B2
MSEFHTKIYCKNCSKEINVIGSLYSDSNLNITIESKTALALNPVETGFVVTTEGNKKDINFDILCPECDKFENYQSLI